MADRVQIELSKIGKRYKRWIFRDINLIFQPSRTYGITGHNGIGKSTLLRIISGYTSPSSGTVKYSSVSKGTLDAQAAATSVAFAAPYIDLIDELTVLEMVNFHCSFKNVFPDLIDHEAILNCIDLASHGDVLVGELSSGLMQRLKVGLMIITDTPVLLLDEPTSYLDLQGKRWYHALVQKYQENRLIIVASNDLEDVAMAETQIDMGEFVSNRQEVSAV